MTQNLASMITRPTLLLDEAKARANIQKMAEKARRSGVQFRPHLKTPQSAHIADWFREEGVTAVTASSLEMAAYFIDHGWDDVTVAFPINVRQLDLVNELAKRATLHILVSSADVLPLLETGLTDSVQVWLEIDAGYGRTGFLWQAAEPIWQTAVSIQNAPHMQLAGLLTHAGNTYTARSAQEVVAIHNETMTRLLQVQSALRERGVETAVSIGDTPACAVLEQFEGVDEIRPGNFVFFDVMQTQIGSCTLDDIAVAVACPVVSVLPAAQQIVVYGGAVHLSKEAMTSEHGWVEYGRIAHLTEGGWTVTSADSYVKGVSQEHGIIHASLQLCESTQIGDLLLILPVHSCLTANLLKQYLTLDNQQIAMADIH